VVEADAAYDKFVEDNLRRNYLGHYVHGMLGMTGFRLVNTPTFDRLVTRTWTRIKTNQ
jgi:hypothetical protein